MILSSLVALQFTTLSITLRKQIFSVKTTLQDFTYTKVSIFTYIKNRLTLRFTQPENLLLSDDILIAPNTRLPVS